MKGRRLTMLPPTIRFDREALRATAHTADGQQLPAVVGYWLAWYAFNPKTAVFRAGQHRSPKTQPLNFAALDTFAHQCSA